VNKNELSQNHTEIYFEDVNVHSVKMTLL